jgi:hypothetical protein
MIYNNPPGSFEDDYYNRLAEKGILEYGTADYFPQKSGIEHFNGVQLKHNRNYSRRH